MYRHQSLYSSFAVIGSSLTVSHLGWRWTMYIEAIFVFTIVGVGLFALPEVYGPVLLKRRAIRLREATGNQAYWHPHEEVKLDFKSIVTKQISRPLRMLFTEPMVTCMTLYASFVYGLLYLTFVVFPIVFEEIRGWKPVVSALPFFALFVGVLLALAIILMNQPRYTRIVDENKGRPVPEARLPPMLIGGVLFVIGLFWFGWTAAPSHHWLLPVIAAVFIGAGFNVIFRKFFSACSPKDPQLWTVEIGRCQVGYVSWSRVPIGYAVRERSRGIRYPACYAIVNGRFLKQSSEFRYDLMKTS